MNPFFRPTAIRIVHSVVFALGFLCLGFHPSLSRAAVLATGVFQSKEAGLTAMGEFEVQENGGKFQLVVKSDFKVSDGPDLFFVFHPLPADQVTWANAKTLSLKIDPQLAKLSGGQTVDLPNDFNVAKYPSLLVHCWKFNHLYAAGAVKLQAGAAVKPNNARRANASEAGKPLIRREGGRLLAREGKPDRPAHDFTGRIEVPGR